MANCRFLEKSKQLTSVRSFPDKNKVAVSFHNDELFVVESSKLSSSSSILKVTSQALIGSGSDALQMPRVAELVTTAIF